MTAPVAPPAGRVALVSATSPVPVVSGKTLVLRGLLSYLCDRFGAPNVHYLLLAHPTEPLPPLPCPMHRVPPPSRLDQLSSLVVQSAVTGRRSMQESALRSARTSVALGATLAALQPDLVLWDTLRLAQYAGEAPAGARQVVYLDDLFSERYRRLLELLDREPGTDLDALGQFAGHLPAPLRAVARLPRVQRSLLRREMKLVRRREDAAARSFAHTLLVSPTEVRLLRARSGAGGVVELPPLWAGPAREPSRRPSSPPEFVFLGRLDLPHNVDAVRTLARRCAAQVGRLQPDARLRIVGPGADRRLLDELAQLPNVVVDGFVEDLDQVLATCTAMVAPVRMAGGVKTKLLDAIARAVPVVASSAAVDGFRTDTPVGPGVLVEDDLGRWPALLRALTDPERNATASRAARLLYEQEYAPAVVTARYDDIFRGRAARLVS